MIIFFTFAQFSLRTFIRLSVKALFQLEIEVIDFAWIVIYFISRSVVLLLTENENVYHLQTILYFMIGHRRNLWYKPKKKRTLNVFLMDYCMSRCSWKNMSNQNNLMPFCFKGNTLEPDLNKRFRNIKKTPDTSNPWSKGLYIL